MPVSSARGRILIDWLTRAGGFGLIGLFLLAIVGSHQHAAANADTRTLSFHNVHTGEDITVTFKRNGRFDQAELKRLNWFLRDWREEKQTEMDPHLIDLLWQVYREVGASQPIHVICGYRSPQTNKMLRARSSGVASNSQHIDGHAIDFFIPGVPLSRLREAGMKLQEGGVGFYPHSGSPFVHMDTASIRHWPRMSREQLVKLFPDGRTVHVPADGIPLDNFALALADVGRRGKSPNATVLAQARAAGVITEEQEFAVAQATERPQKNLLAALFGFGNNDANRTEPVQPPPAVPSAASAGPVNLSAPRRVARNDRVPLPSARPKTFAIAAAEPKPILVAAAVPQPADVESHEPIEPETPEPAAAEPGPATPKQAPSPVVTAAVEESLFDRRGYWQGAVPPPPATLAALKAKAVFAAAPADPATTGTTGNLVLAYAGPAGKTASPAPKATARPMGAGAAHLISTAEAASGRDNVTVMAKSLPATMAIGGQHLGSPWLRATLLTPSVHGVMSTTRLGPVDPRTLQELLHKPQQSLVMTFSADPHGGMLAHAFSGEAVVFLATATFYRAQTASLQ